MLNNMIAISSFRPMDEDAEYARNQIAARVSWEPLFKSIFYLSAPDEQMAAPNVTCVAWEPFPTILAVSSIASSFSELVAVLNADIVLAPAFKEVETHMQQRGFEAAMSRRYQFRPGAPLSTGALVDAGLDIFIASPNVWMQVHDLVPPEFRIGHNRWDTFMLGALNYLRPGRVLDFTRAKVVFHPVHGGRRQPYAISDKIPIPFFSHTSKPRIRM